MNKEQNKYKCSRCQLPCVIATDSQLRPVHCPYNSYERYAEWRRVDDPCEGDMPSFTEGEFIWCSSRAQGSFDEPDEYGRVVAVEKDTVKFRSLDFQLRAVNSIYVYPARIKYWSFAEAPVSLKAMARLSSRKGKGIVFDVLTLMPSDSCKDMAVYHSDYLGVNHTVEQLVRLGYSTMANIPFGSPTHRNGEGKWVR